jgi:dihydrodipicolinate synthase/N-acetylneuraminate lyase
MQNQTALRGMIVATLTPYDADGNVDLGLAREHAAFLVDRGIEGLAPGGTTGEFLYLSDEEKSGLARAAVAGAAGRARVVASIWSLCPDGVVALARGAEEAGADAAFLTTPIYYRYSTAAIAAWYRNAAAATRLPLYAYNIPAYSGNEVPLAVFQELVSDGTLAGIKDSAADAARLEAELTIARGRAAVFAASDAFALEARRLGADGFISALANAFPRTFLAIWEGSPEAQQLAGRLRAGVKDYGGIAALKHLLAARGFRFGATRLPFSNLDASAQAALDRLLQDIGAAE